MNAKKIAGYEILEDLGPVAWGKAFRARQVSLDRTVSLTILDPDRMSRSVAVLAKACAAITHPHLVSGIDLGEEDGLRYLVTEWIEGPTVGDLVRRGGPMAEERALEILLAAVQGLEHASRKGLVHGNLNPEAVVITSGGNPKLRGFGADREAVRCEMDFRSPEQKRGEATDSRSDIYSLGLVLHFELGGTDPFEEAPPAQVTGSQVVEVPRPLSPRRVSPETLELLDRMLAPTREDRHPDAAELLEDVELSITKIEERVSLRPGRPAKPASRPGNRRSRSIRSRRRRRR